MAKFKKHWKTILIIVLTVFGMSKCTTACNRSSTIDKQTVAIDSLKHRSDSLLKVTDMQSLEINQMNSRINDNKEIAIGNNTYWQDSVTVLNVKLRNMTNKYDNEVKEHNKTKKELKKLQESK